METPVYLCFASAFEYWCMQRPGGSLALEGAPTVRERLAMSDVRAVRLRSVARRAPGDARVRRLLATELRGLALPVDLMVSQANGRRESLCKRCHVWGGPLPPGSFVRIAQGVYVSSPEFTMLQLAARLTVAELAKLFFEVCGVYSLPYRGQGASVRCSPLTSAAALGRFLGRVGRVRGAARARRAARLVADGSASPMETAMVALACLPKTLGGYGLPLPAMNYGIDVPRDVWELTGCRRVVCDAYWPDRGYVLEYDGRLYHTGSESVARDYARANALSALGISAAFLTRRELYDAVRFDRAVGRLAKGIGVRLRRDQGFGPAWRAKRSELRRVFLEDGDAWREPGDCAPR